MKCKYYNICCLYKGNVVLNQVFLDCYCDCSNCCKCVRKEILDKNEVPDDNLMPDGVISIFPIHD